ncbi:hypothetical protein FA95DRAFT_1512051 [Auriscalpium vulgare]|uniref:Uncharacterized protein n=1 Tax=Auriscalpium vulgare TaxID=40419 RepID=A0ACB8S5G3_9AGAM|nr:hypothetical protein FA95DRAFT_1512051 [Auriscalpium vulgare]
MVKKATSLREALGTLVRARPAVCPNPGFIAPLKNMESRVRGESSLDVDVLPAKKEDRVALFRLAV